jgi:hypothetical protein
MIRAVAMGLARAVRRLILLPLFMLTGTISILAFEVVVSTRFFLHRAVAEWAIRCGQATRSPALASATE